MQNLTVFKTKRANQSLPIILKFISAFLILFSLNSCEDVVNIDVPKNEEKLVVDAQINDGPGIQTIKLMVSQPYFDNTLAPPATGAIAKIKDSEGKTFEFFQREDKDGKPTQYFDWKPKKGEKLGKVGLKYTFEVTFKGETYQAYSEIRPAPQIDSLIYVFKDNSNLPGGDATKEKKGYRPEFFARDLKGAGDCYFIKGQRFISKEKRWNQDQEQIAYDAAFQPGSRADGLVFILPIRRSITSNLLQEGDSIRTEIFSITEDHFNFLRAIGQEIQNQGLFATPPATIPTNIININKSSTKKALGWFSGAGLSTFQVAIDPKKASKDTD